MCATDAHARSIDRSCERFCSFYRRNPVDRELCSKDQRDYRVVARDAFRHAICLEISIVNLPGDDADARRGALIPGNNCTHVVARSVLQISVDRASIGGGESAGQMEVEREPRAVL